VKNSDKEIITLYDGHTKGGRCRNYIILKAKELVITVLFCHTSLIQNRL